MYDDIVQLIADRTDACTAQGKSFVQYVTEKRMNLAVQLLSDPEIKIYEIAYKVGYEESKHFTKTFKNYFGVSPDKFRNRTVIKSSNNEK